MKLLPQRKTLVGYARKIIKAHSKVQIEILQQSYRERLEKDEREVLDYLCSYRLMQHDTAAELRGLVEDRLPPLRSSIEQFARRFASNGVAAQRAVDEIIAEHHQKERAP